jgi:hypothetical protein
VTRDIGAVDVSIQMLFGMVAVLFALLLVFDTSTYWHGRNVYNEAAAEGARVAAAFDGTCAEGIAAAEASVRQSAGAWARDVRVSCTDGPMVTVTVAGSTPGVLGGALGFSVRVSESVPKEQ